DVEVVAVVEVPVRGPDEAHRLRDLMDRVVVEWGEHDHSSRGRGRGIADGDVVHGAGPASVARIGRMGRPARPRGTISGAGPAVRRNSRSIRPADHTTAAAYRRFEPGRAREVVR